jgi:PAS domain S-box-containing protein
MSTREEVDRSPTPAASKERVELALDTGSIGTWEWDPVADQVIWSENFERVHGFPRGAFGGSLATYAANIHPQDRPGVVEALQACASGGPDYRVEYRLVTPDGAVHHVEASGRRIQVPSGGERLIGVCRDVSERVALLERERAARSHAERSELHYRTLAAAIPQQVWTATPDGALDFVNQRAVEYFGRRAEDIIGAGWQAVVHPDDLAGVVERWTRSLNSGEGYEVEFRLRRHDAQYRWHLGRATPARDGSGRVAQWLGTNTDIDDSKRMLALMTTQVEVADLLVNARSLDAVADSLLETVCRNLGWTCAQLWVVDQADGRLHRKAGWCPSGCNFDELATVAEMRRGVGLPGRIWETASPAWIEDVQHDPNFPRAGLLTRLGLRSAFGFPLIVSGGVSAVLELFSAEVRPFDRAVVAMTTTFGNHIGQFIERIHAENRLSDAIDRLRRLQEVTDVALSHLSLSELLDKLLPKIRETVACDIVVVWLMDESGEALYPAAINGNAVPLRSEMRMKIGTSLGGMAAAERKTKTCRHATKQPFIPEEMRALGVESIAAVPLLCRDRLLGVLVVGARADIVFTPDQIGFVELVAHRLANAIDNASRYEDARQSIVAKDRFLSIASHELKTPMTGILGWTQFLRTETDPELQREALRSIEESARAQSRLVEDLLDSARIREGKIVLQLEECDLTTLVDGAVRTIAPQAEQRGVLLETAHGEQPIRVLVDPNRIQQVMWNLLSNAIKFTPPGGHVRCTTLVREGTATVRVDDEGAGIDPAFLSRVFNAFEQEERGKAAGGLGLGLHIVATIVKMHAGAIHAHSGGVGLGASFVVELPLSQTAAS